jgi:hypothetical protein
VTPASLVFVGGRPSNDVVAAGNQRCLFANDENPRLLPEDLRSAGMITGIENVIVNRYSKASGPFASTSISLLAHLGPSMAALRVCNALKSAVASRKCRSDWPKPGLNRMLRQIGVGREAKYRRGPEAVIRQPRGLKPYRGSGGGGR